MIRGGIMGLNGRLVVAYMESKGYRVKKYNLVGVEGIADDGKLNDDALGLWNDTVMVVKDNGTVTVEANGTTEPGHYYTQKPMNVDGAARLAIGQHHNAWQFGFHNKNPRHPALVQVSPVKVHRDLNKDGLRVNDKVYTGLFGINVHSTMDMYQPGSIGKWSAGCVVTRSMRLHNKMLSEMAKNGEHFYSVTIIDGSDLAKYAKNNKIALVV